MKAKEYFPALTGVRGFAAFMIFLDHYNQKDFPPLLFRILNEFHFPLPMFFVLSGFLICLRYYDNVQLSGNWMRKYIKNRIARVYPVYLILTTLTFLIAWVLNDDAIYNKFSSHLGVYFMNITFLRGFFEDLKFTGIGQGWSLTVEECFYFSAPLFFIWIQKNRKNFFYIPAILILSGVVLVFVFRHINFYGFFIDFKFMFIYTFFGRCVEFFAGMGLAMIIRKTDESLSNYSIYTWLGILGIASTTFIMVLQPISPEVPFALFTPVGIIVNNFVLPFAIATFFYGLIKEKSAIRTFLSSPQVELFGRSSYIFYLIHLGYIAKFSTYWIDKGTNKFFDWLYENDFTWLAEHLSWPVIILTSLFTVLTIISIILFKLVEEPLNLYIRKSSLLEKKN